jgi:hypothetical protein
VTATLAKAKTRVQLSDVDFVERMQSILINAADGRRSIADDRQYAELRKQFKRRHLIMPSMVETHPTVDSFMGFMSGIKNRVVRVENIREEFAPVLLSAKPLAPHRSDNPASDWTGRPSRIQRLKVVRELLPVARSSIEAMIAELSEPGPNGGPLLDEHEEAIAHLRQLHGKLGELIAAIDGGRFSDDLGEGLVADAIRLAKTIGGNLRDEPLPCALAALLLGIFSAAHMPTTGAFLSEATFHLSRKAKTKSGS